MDKLELMKERYQLQLSVRRLEEKLEKQKLNVEKLKLRSKVASSMISQLRESYTKDEYLQIKGNSEKHVYGRIYTKFLR